VGRLKGRAEQSPPSTPDCVLVIDKPAGPTSHDVVAIARRAMGVRQIGHTGTLDPLATGVLALVVGRATRLAAYLSGADKEYVAKVRFGAATATYDAEAPRDAAGAAPIPRSGAEIEDRLHEFRGTYLQQPPPFSAKKIGGTPAYKLARQQKTVEITPAQVTVRELQLRSYRDGVAELRLVCSSGFYVRSLAHDLGQRTGCGAFLEELRRTRSGDFTLQDALALDEVMEAGHAAGDRGVPMHRLLPWLPAVVLSSEGARRTAHGNTLGEADLSPALPALGNRWDGSVDPSGGRVRLLNSDGALIGLAESRAPRTLHPVLVLV
jgi:tRNA pseudouridine55 synthase